VRGLNAEQQWAFWGRECGAPEAVCGGRLRAAAADWRPKAREEQAGQEFGASEVRFEG